MRKCGLLKDGERKYGKVDSRVSFWHWHMLVAINLYQQNKMQRDLNVLMLQKEDYTKLNLVMVNVKSNIKIRMILTFHLTSELQ